MSDATSTVVAAPGVPSDSFVAENAIALAVLWPLILLAIFVPLSIRRYRHLSR